VRDYLIGHAGRVAETDDFRRALEERSGLSLEHFFEQWFHRPGFPDLQVSFRHDAERAEGVFEIVQKQADEKTGDGAFSFDLELAWGNASAPALERTRVRVSGRRTLAVISMASAPELLRVDPDGLVLHRLDFDPGSERLLRQLAAPDARGRIQAGVLLVRHAGRTGARALRAAFEAEPSWGVRAKWSEALGKAASEAALEALLAIAEEHDHPRSLAAVFRALGKYRDPRVTDVLIARLDRGLPYRATEAAYEALGALAATLADRPRERAIEALSDALRDPLLKVQLSAARALGHARAREAEPALEALAQRLSRQDQVRVLRVLRALRNPEQEPARAQELDQLQERVRKLAQEVDELKARAEAKQPPPSS
jgi:aminopeptidase N